MSVATARFYKMRGSLSSGEYPLFNVNQDLSGYLVHSVSVKYAKGLQTNIVVPMFTGFEDCNIAELDGEFYWITAWHEATSLNGTVSMTLDYMGPTSLLRRDDPLTGMFQKTPANVAPYLKQSITNGLMRISQSLEPTNLEIGTVYRDTGTYPSEDVGYWVQVSGFDKDPITDEPILRRVGFPIGVRKDTLAPSANKVRYLANNENYPRYGDLINDITACTGIQADQVIDCSISKRCPYKFQKTEETVSATVTKWKITLLDTNNVPIQPQLMNDGTTVVYYLGFRPATAQYQTVEQTVTIDTSSEYVRSCGSIQIRDWNENAVMEIPIDGTSVDITFRPHDDESGLYTIVTHANQQISIPEGKLPYVENTWETYKAYQMDTDRMSMENAIRFAEYQRETQRVVGTINSAISGATSGLMAGFISGSGAGAAALAVGGAVGGMMTDLYGQDRAVELARMQAKADFELSKRQAIDQPQTSYNVAYGLIYITLNQINRLRACLVMPYDVDASYFADWVTEYGYPSEGRKTIAVVPGYYLGKALSLDGDASGMYWDAMNSTLEKGFKFVSPGIPSVLNAVLSGSGFTEKTGGITYSERPTLTVNGDAYTAIVSNMPWSGSFVKFFNRDDLAKYAGWIWGQSTGTEDPDDFGYCRYYFVNGTLYGTASFMPFSTYAEIAEPTASAVLEHYAPRISDAELSEWMRTHEFNTLDISDE